jgi:hypothetical protein
MYFSLHQSQTSARCVNLSGALPSTWTIFALTPAASKGSASFGHIPLAEFDAGPAPAFRITIILVESNLPVAVIGESR